MSERFVVERALTKQVLTYEAPNVGWESITRKLSAVGTMVLTVPVSVQTMIAADGEELFLEWSSIVSLVDEDQIRFRGIVVNIDGATIEVASMGAYLHGMPFEGDPYYGAKVDPAAVVRMLWAHVQSFPDSDLGITVVGSTPIRTGTYSTQNKTDAIAAYNAAVKAYNRESAQLKGLRDIVAASRRAYSALVTQRTAASRDLTAAKKIKPKNQAAIDRAQTALNAADNAKAIQNAVIADQQGDVDAQAKVVASAKQAKDSAYATKVAASKQAKDDGGAYTLLWWEAPDCGQAVDDLAQRTPFDWVEQHYWSGDQPATRIRIAYPRVGRRLDGAGDPTFVQGINMSEPLVPRVDGDDFANSVFGVGAGEGVGSIRRVITRRNGRLRRVAAFQSKDIKTNTDMESRMRAELNARQNVLAVESVTVRDHPSSPRGSFSLGDDVFLRGRTRYFGDFKLWHRIVGITERPNGSSELQVQRSDSFTYGTGVPE